MCKRRGRKIAELLRDFSGTKNATPTRQKRKREKEEEPKTAIDDPFEIITSERERRKVN
jgi:hypothetical protein